MDDPAATVGPWSRRRTLKTLAAAGVAAACPVAAAARPGVPPALARICVAATSAPLPARLGAAVAAGWRLDDLALRLTARLAPGEGAEWGAALVAAGRRDLARGDRVEVLGRPLMRTEAEVLALGTLLRRAAA
jgi:hypothetical protein